MSCTKNIGITERLLRGILGALTIPVGLLWQGITPLGIGLAATGLVAVLTALFSYCPACAIIGRKPLP